MSGMDNLTEYMQSKSFRSYMKSSGVVEYKYFAGIDGDYDPSLADAAMSMVESIGKKRSEELGIRCEAGGVVLVDGEMIGRSKLAQGKSCKDLTISIWLEDVGQFGFSVASLKYEMDEKLGDGWFDKYVTPLIDSKLTQQNRARELDEYKQRRETYKPWWKTAYTKLKEWPSRRRVRAHYRRLEAA